MKATTRTSLKVINSFFVLIIVLLELKIKFGFLFTGYRPELYWWECVQMYKKMLIVLPAVFLSQVYAEA